MAGSRRFDWSGLDVDQFVAVVNTVMNFRVAYDVGTVDLSICAVELAVGYFEMFSHLFCGSVEKSDSQLACAT